MVNANPGRESGSGNHPSRLQLAGYLAGQAAAADRAAFEAHLSGCAHCSDLLAEARTDAAYFAHKHPTLESLAATRPFRPRARASSDNGQAGGITGWAQRLRGLMATRPLWRPGLAALILLAGGALLVKTQNPVIKEGGDLSSKGVTPKVDAGRSESASFYLFLNGGQTHGDTLAGKASDTLQLGIIGPKPVHYAVLYRDDDGEVKTYMGAPERETLGSPKGDNLPHSLVLEGNWKRETLFCVLSERPFSLEEAKAAIAGAGNADVRIRKIVLLAPR
jgi:hypothetical protein